MNDLTAMGNHMPYGITQCYLPPYSGDFPAFRQEEAGTRFSDSRGMQGRVNRGDGISQDSSSAKDGQPSQK